MPKGLFHQCHHFCCRGCCDWHRHRKSDLDKTPLASYIQIIAAKFLLEVIGAAGAIWGSSEILHLRDTPEGTEIIRMAAMSVGGIFLIRYWWHCKHWWQHERDYMPTKTIYRRRHRLAFFQIHASKFILQVLGGAGAIWGCAEAATLRNSTNTMEWRIAATAVGTMFLIRWAFQILAYCLFLAALWSNPSSIHMKLLRWFEALVVKLILEVFGAVGAVWGFSEIVTLRNPETNRIWRPIALAIGVIFFGRWILHLINFTKSERESVPAKSQVQVDLFPQEVEDLEIADLEFKETTSTDELNEASSTMGLHLSMEANTSTDALNEASSYMELQTTTSTDELNEASSLNRTSTDALNEATSTMELHTSREVNMFK
ncbi:hypothetical protein ACHAXR_004365 [Thalassiosira sp. AJA248-18]